MTLPPLPESGLPSAEILDALAQLRSLDLDYTKATSYHFESGNPELREVALATERPRVCRRSMMRRTSINCRPRSLPHS